MATDLPWIQICLAKLQVLILVFMILLSFAGLLYSSAMGNHQDSLLFNLGRVPDPRDIFNILQDIRQYLDEEGDGKDQELIESLEPKLNWPKCC